MLETQDDDLDELAALGVLEDLGDVVNRGDFLIGELNDDIPSFDVVSPDFLLSHKERFRLDFVDHESFEVYAKVECIAEVWGLFLHLEAESCLNQEALRDFRCFDRDGLFVCQGQFD